MAQLLHRVKQLLIPEFDSVYYPADFRPEAPLLTEPGGLTVRALTPGDGSVMAALARQVGVENARWLPWTTELEPASGFEHYRAQYEEYCSPPALEGGVTGRYVLVEYGGRAVGTVGLDLPYGPWQPAAWPGTCQERCTELSYWSVNAAPKGAMTNAVLAVLASLAIDPTPPCHVIARTQAENAPSRGLLARTGFAFIGEFAPLAGMDPRDAAMALYVQAVKPQ